MTLSLLASCTGTNGNENGEGGEGGGEGGGTSEEGAPIVYGGDQMPLLVMSDSLGSSRQTELYQGLKAAYGSAPDYYFASEVEAAPSEIVVGPCDRAISVEAYRRLERVKAEDEYSVRYLVYAEDGSVAIAYDEDVDDIGEIVACEEFLGRVVADNSELRLDDGVVISDTVDSLEYLQALDDEYYEKRWALVEQKCGKELTDALKDLWAVYNHDVVEWLANLYDPAVGGFYYANSGRDTYGYGPDTESTSQALNFIGNLASVSGKDYPDVLSDRIKNEIVTYVKSLQDESGFFYNYQWTKADTDAHLIRRARDLTWSTGILAALGAKPTYDTPSGAKGDGVVVKGNYTRVPEARIYENNAVFAARVVLSASYADHFESNEVLVSFLEGLREKYSFYYIGSELSSEASQVLARDKVLKAEFEADPANAGKTYFGLADTLTEWFEKYQNPDTGLWSAPSYDAINGVLKITALYNGLGREMKYSESAAIAALDAVTSDEKQRTIVDLYNTWGSISGIIKNLRQYGSTIEVDGVSMTGKQRADKLLETVYTEAVDAVLATIDKVKVFMKEDGSFSYQPNYPAQTSNGMPVAVFGVCEGDVNATVLASTGLVVNITGSLEITTVRIFARRDLRVLLTLLESREPVIKYMNPEDYAK